MFNREKYDYFVSQSAVLSIMQTEGIFEIAPNITSKSAERVSAIFTFKKGEEILLIRKNYKESYFVITTLGIYHNIGTPYFCAKWKDISSADGGTEGISLLRNKRCVLSFDYNCALYGFHKGSSKRKKLANILKTFPEYIFIKTSKQERISDVFLKTMSQFSTEMWKEDLWLVKDNVPGEYCIPDNETVLMYRCPFFSGAHFLVTDNALYYIHEYENERSFRMIWESIYSVYREGKSICFQDKQGHRVSIPLNHVVNRRKGLLEKEESIIKDIDAVVNAFSTVLQSVERTSDVFIESFEEHPATMHLSPTDDQELYGMRCPFCGSDSYALSEGYYKEDNKARTKHDLQDIGFGVITALLGKKPTPSPYYSSVTPEYRCLQCHKTWRVKDE